MSAKSKARSEWWALAWPNGWFELFHYRHQAVRAMKRFGAPTVVRVRVTVLKAKGKR